MAFELLPNNFNNGQGYVVMPLLATLMLFSSLSAPVSVADMRAELETAQPQPFENDDWDLFVSQLAAVQLQDGVLTEAERSVYNTLRAAASPPPSTRCCGTAIPANSDGLTEGKLYLRTGSVTNQTQVQLSFDKSYTCDIATVEVTIGELGGAPVPDNPTNEVYFTGCNDLGQAVYSYFWVTFPSNPIGGTYNLEFHFKDSAGATIASYAAAYNTVVQ